MSDKTAHEIAIKAEGLVWSARRRPWTAWAARNWLALAARQARKHGRPGLAELLEARNREILN